MNRHEIERATLVRGLEPYDAQAIERYRRRARTLRAEVMGNALRGIWRGLVARQSARR